MSDNLDTNKSDKILSEINKRKEQLKIDSVEQAKIGLVIFTLGNDLFAFKDTDVKEILSYREITFVPGCSDNFLGIINVRGDIESVINIHKLIRIPEKKPGRETRIIITAKGELHSGILVDSVNDVIEIPESVLKPPLSTIDPIIAEYAVAGEILYDQKYVTILDVGKIFHKLLSIKDQSH